MLQCSFSLAAAQLLVKMTSALQKSQCCSATSAAQHSENCSATSVFACGMLQGRGLEGWGLGHPQIQRNLNCSCYMSTGNSAKKCENGRLKEVKNRQLQKVQNQAEKCTRGRQLVQTSPEFPGICRHFPESPFGISKSRFRGEDEVDMSAGH